MPRAAKAAPTPSPSATNYPVITDKVVIAAAEEYVALQATSSKTEARLKELKAKLIEATGGAPTAIAGKRIITVNEVPPIPPTDNVVITAKMVGQVIPGSKGRAGYRQLSVR